MTARPNPLAVLALLGLLLFANLALHPGQMLYSDYSDLLAETLPAKRFLVSSWQNDGELPLWCPYSYAGNPFLHDVKVGVFYPPHLPLYVLPASWLAPALSWLVVLHVVAAGWCMYFYARSQGLDYLPALVAAAGYMFAGKWVLHLLAAGHYFMAPMAWLPLVLLLLEGAVRTGGLLRATGAGAAFALIVLGAHPQITFYSGLFVALWSLAPALERAGYLGAPGPRSGRRTAAALGAWRALGAWTAVVAVALGAVELLPALEATRESSRAVGVASDGGAATAAWMLLNLFGPAPGGPSWEHRGGLGVFWVAAAALAPLLRRGRARFHAGAALALLLFALGGGTLLQGVPGFGLFQLHSRMLLPATLAVALLAGSATQALFAGPGAAAGKYRPRVLAGVALAALALTAGALGLDYFDWRRRPAPQDAPAGWAGRLDPDFLLYWGAVLALLPAALFLVRRAGRRYAAPGWALVLLAEAWALAGPLVRVRPETVLSEPSACVAYLAGRGGGPFRVLDREQPEVATGSPLGPALPMLLGIEPLRGYNSLDVRRYKEYLRFVADVADPVRAREGMFGRPVLENFPVKNKPLLDLLGTRYLLQPADGRDLPARGDGWREVFRDEGPEAYLVVAGGRRRLAPFVVYENPGAFPRAFVVPEAAPMPDRPKVLQALKAADFRRTVLLEGWEPGGGSPGAAGNHTVGVREYRPNRVVLDVDGDAPGYLVLADVWYPGWKAAVDGEGRQVYRANYLFRAVEVPAGKHEVTFTFEPDSYRLGKAVSGVALLGVVTAAAFALVRRRVSGPSPSAGTAAPGRGET